MADAIPDCCHDEWNADDGASSSLRARDLVHVLACGAKVLVRVERGLRKSQVALEVGESQGDGFLRSAKDHPPERTGDFSVAEDRRQAEHRNDTAADARQTEQVERDSGDGRSEEHTSE